MLVSEIATRVKRQFGDEAGAQITDADILRWVNDAQREIAVANDLLQAIATTPITVNDVEYTLPPDLLVLRNVYVDDRLINALSEQEAAKYQAIGNTTASGETNSYWVFANKINIYPMPTKAGVLKIYYTRQALEVTDLNNTPELSTQYHNRIVEYCIAQAYELDDNFESYRQKMDQFNQGVSLLKGQGEHQPQDVYPSITVAFADFGEDWG